MQTETGIQNRPNPNNMCILYRLKAMSALACLVTRGEGPGQDEDQGELIDPTFLAELISHFSIVLHETSNLSEQCSALAIERGMCFWS